MIIGLILDDVIRNCIDIWNFNLQKNNLYYKSENDFYSVNSLIKQTNPDHEIIDFYQNEWNDIKNLIIPTTYAEDKINLWYDLKNNIYIFDDSLNIIDDSNKWLQNHYIPYDYFIQDIYKIREINFDLFIYPDLYSYFNYRIKSNKSIIINEYSNKNYENLIFCKWESIEI